MSVLARYGDVSHTSVQNSCQIRKNVTTVLMFLVLTWVRSCKGIELSTHCVAATTEKQPEITCFFPHDLQKNGTSFCVYHYKGYETQTVISCNWVGGNHVCITREGFQKPENVSSTFKIKGTQLSEGKFGCDFLAIRSNVEVVKCTLPSIQQDATTASPATTPEPEENEGSYIYDEGTDKHPCRDLGSGFYVLLALTVVLALALLCQTIWICHRKDRKGTPLWKRLVVKRWCSKNFNNSTDLESNSGTPSRSKQPDQTEYIFVSSALLANVDEKGPPMGNGDVSHVLEANADVPSTTKNSSDCGTMRNADELRNSEQPQKETKDFALQGPPSRGGGVVTKDPTNRLSTNI